MKTAAFLGVTGYRNPTPPKPGTVTRHVWAEAKERTDGHRLTAWGEIVYRRRKETVERFFADAKQA